MFAQNLDPKPLQIVERGLPGVCKQEHVEHGLIRKRLLLNGKAEQ